MKVVLEGHGQKLRSEVASTAKVKRFLEYVPHFMGLIKAIHSSVVENNIELLRAKTSAPVPPQMLNCKDVNGLTPLHKVKISIISLFYNKFNFLKGCRSRTHQNSRVFARIVA